MNKRYEKLYYIALKRYRRAQKSKAKKKGKRSEIDFKNRQIIKILGRKYNFYDALHAFLPKNLKYLLFDCDKSHININKLIIPANRYSEYRILVPQEFSLINCPKESYAFVREVVSALVLQRAVHVIIDYSKCEKVTLDAQVFLDVILKDIITFFKRCREYKRIRPFVRKLRADNVQVEDVRKMLWSVGSPAIHADSTMKYPDIIPYKLCIHNGLSKSPKNINRKDIDTTLLADYVMDSLRRLNRELPGEKIEDLCIVISEILINAEEHSTNKYRFSIGYFTEKDDDNGHYGVFRLVIMNFGMTIYEKFKDPDCPNPNSVQKMRELSDTFSRRKLFFQKKFEEETLWTLYSLQEGITCTDPKEYKRRGNGSIRFIESFFNLKGDSQNALGVSKMVLMSGNSRIEFDGSYKISSKSINGESFKYVTFNESDDIMNKPDPKFVKFVDNYFPGTIICAEIIFNEDNLEYGNDPK